MKRYITVILCLWCYSISAQPYIPFLEEGNTWSVDVYYDILPPCDPTPCVFTVTVQIALGDTELIGGIEYKRVVSDGSNTCLLREENGLVFKYDEANETDRLLFDFTLEVGDVFLVAGSAYEYAPPSCVNQVYGPGIDLEVIAVDTVELAGQSRKVITFDSDGSGVNFQWIEGIGNITGFDFMYPAIDITSHTALICFETNGTNYFFNEATSCDNTTLGTPNFNENLAVLYPNPVADISLLQFASEGIANTVKIFDVQGKMVKEFQLTSRYLRLNAMEFRSGLYFYQIYSEKQLLATEKFIVR